MEPLSFLTIMAVTSWITNIYDYISFSNKHDKTREEIKYLKGEISTLSTRLSYMTQEITENNKLIKTLESKNAINN